MSHDRSEDVPSPIDLRSIEDARQWAASAMQNRPWRAQVFQRFITELRAFDGKPLRILELGSGPGFLAQSILEAIPAAEYTMLDFSQAMHALARQRLGRLANKTREVLVDFRDDGWSVGLGKFDAVITNQAVHELRHKKHAIALHRTVLSLLSVPGRYLVSDHYVGQHGMSNTALYMTVEEQRNCLEAAGFEAVTNLLEMGGLVLHRAEIRAHAKSP